MESDEILALIREQARMEAQAHISRISPAWRVQQAMRTVAELVARAGDAQAISDDELQRYVAAYLDTYDAAAKAQQVNGGEQV